MVACEERKWLALQPVSDLHGKSCTWLAGDRCIIVCGVLSVAGRYWTVVAAKGCSPPTFEHPQILRPPTVFLPPRRQCLPCGLIFQHRQCKQRMNTAVTLGTHVPCEFFSTHGPLSWCQYQSHIDHMWTLLGKEKMHLGAHTDGQTTTRIMLIKFRQGQDLGAPCIL